MAEDYQDEIEYSEDLPEELKKNLTKRSVNVSGDIRQTILRLLGDHGELNINQLFIGVYRSKELVLKRSAMAAHLKALRERGIVESPVRGTFALTGKGQDLYDKAAGL
jgi:DNA-binding transcriptional ArsR family regulator